LFFFLSWFTNQKEIQQGEKQSEVPPFAGGGSGDDRGISNDRPHAHDRPLRDIHKENEQRVRNALRVFPLRGKGDKTANGRRDHNDCGGFIDNVVLEIDQADDWFLFYFQNGPCFFKQLLCSFDNIQGSGFGKLKTIIRFLSQIHAVLEFPNKRVLDFVLIEFSYPDQ